MGNEMYFYSQSILNGTLAQHRISFGPPKARGFQRNGSKIQNGSINGLNRKKKIRWKDQESPGQSLEEAFEYLSLEEALETRLDNDSYQWLIYLYPHVPTVHTFSVTGIYAILNAIIHAHLNHYHWPIIYREKLLFSFLSSSLHFLQLLWNV